MKLIFIYGPPAAGKLTVGTELARRTGFELFDNHQTIDQATRAYPANGPERAALTDQLRLEKFERAVADDADLIFTIVYGGEADADWVRKVIALVEGSGSKVCFVQLVPPPAVVLQRVTEKSRASTSKLKDPETLQRSLDRFDVYAAVPHSSNLSIDNTSLAPGEVGDRVIEHFGLAAVEGPGHTQHGL